MNWEESSSGVPKIICKVSDFGMAMAIDPTKEQTSHPGTTHYMAPELVKREKNYDFKVDIWALGVIVYQIFSGGEYPFEGEGMSSSKETYMTRKEKRKRIY